MEVLLRLLLATLVLRPGNAESVKEWMDLAQAELDRALYRTPVVGRAKNVILFLGDGMGLTTVTPARILKGQLNGEWERAKLAFEEFPNVGLSKTYNNDRQTSGSASTSTAYQCGVKANYGTIGISPAVKRQNCSAVADENSEYRLQCVHDWARQEGKVSGFVTTARVTHASPAAGYAKSADRNWEGDVNTASVQGGCKDIARQLIEDNAHLRVILGGGRRYFLPNTTRDPGTNTISSSQRKDGRDLIQEWQQDKASRSLSHQYVWNKAQFDSVDPANTDYLMGLFSSSHMSYELDRDNTSTSTGQPSIAEMTRKAIQILSKNPSGYYLFVEGARIDHGHHANLARKALHDVLAFEEAVKVAMEMTSDQETLLVVTADHSHAFDMVGYPYRKSDIFGLVDPVPDSEKAYDGFPYTTLIYSNGPGPQRANLTGVDTTGKDFKMPSAIQMTDDTHGGEEVAIYARGPMAHLFYGVHEQHYIAHVMGYASCMGPNKGLCVSRPRPPSTTCAAPPLPVTSLLGVIALAFLAKLFGSE